MANQPLAYEDPEFLASDDARPIRILAEYLEPLRRLREANIQDTVVFFGSARVHSRLSAERALARLERRTGQRASAAERRRLRRLRYAVKWSRYYEEARALARLLTAWSLTLDSPRHRFVVCSGGGPGIMEAANRGAREAGGKTIGMNIRLPFEQGPNRYITPGLHFEFHYFFMRKFWFAYMAKALVVFPGGFGTLDELFEILTLAQTEKIDSKINVVLYGTEYWDRVLDLEPMVRWGAIDPEDLRLLHRYDTPESAFEFLREYLSRHHLAPIAAPPEEVPRLARTRG
ncbi:MAG TPA: LOG family protein [Vicinamibacterales bacterium]|nr:LOG family protein [Vicinamibacterales bacterium]